MKLGRAILPGPRTSTQFAAATRPQKNRMQQQVTIPRASRYEISTPLLYRRVGDSDWSSGRTVNVSRTGVLFTGLPARIQAATEVEFVLMLQTLGRPGQSRVQCRGMVVRVVRTATEGACAMAATIAGYEFLGIEPEPDSGGGKTSSGGVVGN
jgi:hypothetical protein